MLLMNFVGQYSDGYLITLAGVQVQEVPADAGDVAQPLAPRLRRKTGLERPEVESSGRGGESDFPFCSASAELVKCCTEGFFLVA